MPQRDHVPYELRSIEKLVVELAIRCCVWVCTQPATRVQALCSAVGASWLSLHNYEATAASPYWSSFF